MRYYNDFIAFKNGGRNAVRDGYKQIQKLAERIKNDPSTVFEISQVVKDIEKVEFCHMNVNFIKQVPDVMVSEHGLPYIALSAGSDWQPAILFFVYWDGKKYRAYVPIHGNAINTVNMSAFGEDESDDAEYAEKYGYNYDDIINFDDIMFDFDACLEDFQARVVVDDELFIPDMSHVFDIKSYQKSNKKAETYYYGIYADEDESVTLVVSDKPNVVNDKFGVYNRIANKFMKQFPEFVLFELSEAVYEVVRKDGYDWDADTLKNCLESDPDRWKPGKWNW